MVFRIRERALARERKLSFARSSGLTKCAHVRLPTARSRGLRFLRRLRRRLLVMHLFGLLPDDLAAHLRANGVDVRDAEARRVIAHVMAGRGGFPRSRPVPHRVEEAVERLTTRTPLEIVERATDPTDGFVKYLFRLHDGALAEAVRIPLEAPGKFRVCISSQAGSAMGCSFCATGRLGLIRNLEPWEIVAQWIAVRDEAPGVVPGALFQGAGEPAE